MVHNSDKSERPYNRLKFEKSPYLLQHADNPVEWYPWGQEAFEKARKENKPIFLSIGYSTCHWCHVMEHESFEDPEVARLMNEAFICIKVDREERPDIDKIYMTVCQMLTGSGGWPLTIIMTPDKKPFFAATYIPKESRFGRAGMVDLIPQIKERWATNQSELLNSASQIVSFLTQTPPDSSAKELDHTTLQSAFNQLSQRFDQSYGGFSSSPKFPTPHNLLFLLRYWKRSGDKHALAMVEKTLQAMRLGGIYDHVGYGFHRYSTDGRWFLPHFEKMLYDQAMLAMAYTEAYQATGNEEYEKTAREIFTYVLRDMTAKDGGFFSAEDADSEGEEGKFYLWSQDEIQRILTKEESELIIKIFNLEKEGNFAEEATRKKTGSNLMHLKKPLTEIATDLKMSAQVLQKTLDAARQKLFNVREKRIHPHKDDKILTDWNGLMIAALAKGAQAFDLDDYAFLVWGLIELYEATFEIKYLQTALDLNRDLIIHFWDNKHGGFYFTSDEGEDLLVRQKEVYDGAIPSGNSVAMLNLLRLGRITATTDFEEKAAKIGSAFSSTVTQMPAAYTQLMVALDFAMDSSHEVVIVGDLMKKDTVDVLKTLRAQFVPNKVVLFRPSGEDTSALSHIAPFTKNLSSLNGKTTVYVCTNYTCKMPTTEANTMLDLLNMKETAKTK
ncbi:MAG: thioredoxin domain-containing protein [Deltaproteobacteria bacterium]|nr:thioredoxin domain-containing protein [Deltaproteobacteria bacterium]